MAALIAFYSRADENYFGGDLRYIKVGNTQRAAEMIQEAVGGELFQIRQQEPYSADYRTCVDQAGEGPARPGGLSRKPGGL